MRVTGGASLSPSRWNLQRSSGLRRRHPHRRRHSGKRKRHSSLKFSAAASAQSGQARPRYLVVVVVAV